MGGEDGYDGLVPFETIVRKGVLVREIDDRKQALVEQCRTNNGLTLQEVIDHNDWLLQIERDLSKARARIERDFRISNALSLKVREGKRKAQLQQRLDVLRAQCDVLNECIHGLSDHCAWFQESGTYREAADYLEGRWDDPDDPVPLDDTRFDLRPSGAAGTGAGGAGAAAGGGGGGGAAGGEAGKGAEGGEEGGRHELDGLIHGDAFSASPHEKKRRKKRKGKKGAAHGHEEASGRADNSDDDDDGEGAAQGEGHGASGGGGGGGGQAAADPFAADFRWLRAAGQQGGANGGGGGGGAGGAAGGNGRPAFIDVWAPD